MSVSAMRLVIVLSVLLVLSPFLLSVAASSNLAAQDVSANSCPRLPIHATPLSAEITLSLRSFEDTTFEGLVDFIVHVDLYRLPECVSSFVLHAEDLEISSCSILLLRGDESTQHAIERVRAGDLQGSYSCTDSMSYDTDTHHLTVKTDKCLQNYESYHLAFEYTGKIRDDMTGFYQTIYRDDNQNERKVLATQFQPTHARKVFPCFDEPQYKANYSINIIIPNGYPEYHVMSNMPLEKISSSTTDLRRKYTFHTSVPMSTYLLAWVISDFESVSDEHSKRNVVFKTWSRANALEKAKYSLEISGKMLDTFESYTGIPYLYEWHEPQALNKIDQVAIPDFSAGAMENWGLITYRETALLFDEAQGPEAARRRVALVVAHELAHMWFGNLATTAQWDTTWLNEGFAEYFEQVAVDAVHPEWRMREQFVVDDMHSALAADAFVSASPLTRAACTPAAAAAAFDSLTYTKGASVLRMFSYIVGEDNFREALRRYLNANAFKAVEPEELFRELKVYSEQAGLSYPEMDELLHSWTEQSGYPMVLVIRDYNERTARISQVRYQTVPLKFDYPPYYVPLTWTQRGFGFDVRRPQLYLTTDEPSKVMEGMPDNDTWVIFNIQQTGFYRVNYDFTNWELITNYLVSEANPLDGIHVLNRAQLVDDVLAFGRSGNLPYTNVFHLLDYLHRETDYMPWTAFFNGLSYIDRMLLNEEQYPHFKQYILNLILKLYNRFEFKTQQTHLDNLLMNRVSSWACALDHPHCTTSAVTSLQEFLDDGKLVPANLRSVVYCYGIRNAEDRYWESLWKMYQLSLDDVERSLIIAGLACTRSEDRLEELLNYSLQKDYIRKQDAASVFSSVYSNSLGVEVALDFLTENFEQIQKYYEAMGAIRNIVTGIAGRVSTEEQFQKLNSFLEEYREELGSTADSALEIVQSNLIWLELNAEEIFSAVEEKSLHRLPQSVKPEQYYLHITPDFQNDAFEGIVCIVISVKEATNSILLHVQDLTIEKSNVAVFQYSGSSHIQTNKTNNALEFIHSSRDDNIVNDIKELPDFQLIRIELCEHLTASQQYIIQITYSGPLRTDMVGFYKTYYTDDRGYPHYLAATKFAPTHARKAFPCFDEPSFKARFKITLAIPGTLFGYDALANAGEETRRNLDDGTTEVEFKNSLKMSTYIVAWVISDLDAARDPLDRTMKYTTWARKNAVKWAKYSLDVTADMVAKLEDYTGFPYMDLADPYPLDKLDQVGTPDFVSGAMENWGLITYRETALLYNDGNAAAQKRAAVVIAHELAHMWFGNLVTCAWWEATWLNEGFAEYFEYIVTQHVERRWDLMDLMVTDEVQAALALDADRSSKPLTHRVLTPADAVGSFRSLTYSKGASFLRMLSFVIGEKNLQEAIKSYVKKNAYGAAVPNDLFVELVEYAEAGKFDSKEEMMEFLRSWTEEPGFPLLHVTRYYDGRNTVTLTQERYLASGGDINSQLYYVPLTWVEEGGSFDNAIVRGYLTNRERSKTLTGINENGWLVFNTQHMGFFRVTYDDENWRRLAEALSQRLDIHWLNRAQLLDDAFALARAGPLSYEQLFALTDYLSLENEYPPWAAALNGFAYLDRMLTPHPGYPRFQAYVLHLLHDVYVGYGFQPRAEHSERLLAAAVTARACAMGHQGCRDRAARLLQRDLDGGARVAADMRGAVYCHGVRHSPAAYWDALWERFSLELDEAERALLLAGLGCSAHADQLTRLLEYTINGVGVRKQEASSAFAAVYATVLGVDVTLHFLEENYEETRNYLGSVTSIVSALASRILYNDQRETLVKLIEDRWWDGLSSIGESALQTVDRNFAWLRDNAGNIIQIVDGKTEPPSETTSTPATISTTSSPTTTSTTSAPTTTTTPTSPPTATTTPTSPPTTTTTPTSPPTTTTTPTSPPTTTTTPSPPTTTTTPTTISLPSTSTNSATTESKESTTPEGSSTTTDGVAGIGAGVSYFLLLLAAVAPLLTFF